MNVNIVLFDDFETLDALKKRQNAQLRVWDTFGTKQDREFLFNNRRNEICT